MTYTANGPQGPVQYKHRPTIVEAMPVRHDNMQAVAQWCGGRVKGECVIFRRKTLRPVDDPYHWAQAGVTYIVKKAKGYAVVDAQTFERLYEVK